jgi:hypothetical protein
MKTLANCTTAEFLRQTNKIRKVVADYLKETEILKIRKTLPVFPMNASEEEKSIMMREQAEQNISDMLDKMLDEHAEKTVEVLALMCFKEGTEAQELEVCDILDVALELLTSERVLNFFTRLMQSGLISTGSTSQKSN